MLWRRYPILMFKAITANPETLRPQRTACAFRLSRVADFAAEADGQQMKALHENWIGRQQLIQPRMGITSLRNQAHATHHAPYVGIGWEDRLIERKEQDNTGGLGSHPRQVEKPLERVVQCEIT